MGEESALQLSQRGRDARQGGAQETPEAMRRPRTYAVSPCALDLSPLWRSARDVHLSGVGSDRAEARSRSLGGASTGSLPARHVCRLAPALAGSRGARPRARRLPLGLRRQRAPGLVAAGGPRHLPRDARRPRLPGPPRGVPRGVSVATGLWATPGLPRAAAPRSPGPDGHAAGRRARGSRRLGAARGRAPPWVHPRTRQGRDMAQGLALPAGSVPVRSLAGTAAASGVAHAGRAERPAHGLGTGSGPGRAQQAPSVLAGP
jgi:hypothetical protein